MTRSKTPPLAKAHQGCEGGFASTASTTSRKRRLPHAAISSPLRSGHALRSSDRRSRWARGLREGWRTSQMARSGLGPGFAPRCGARAWLGSGSAGSRGISRARREVIYNPPGELSDIGSRSRANSTPPCSRLSILYVNLGCPLKRPRGGPTDPQLPSSPASHPILLIHRAEELPQHHQNSINNCSRILLNYL